MKKLAITTLTCAALAITSLTGCANMSETQQGTAKGAGIGAVAGALLGAARAAPKARRRVPFWAVPSAPVAATSGPRKCRTKKSRWKKLPPVLASRSARRPTIA